MLGGTRFPVPMVFAGGFLLWALLAPTIVQLPLHWLVTHTESEERRQAIDSFQKMDALQSFGKLTQRLCYVAIATSLVALALEAMLWI